MVFWWTGVIVVASFIAAIAQLIVEVITAPLLDERGHLIEDKYGTLGPKFRLGEEIPECHQDRCYW